MRTKERELLERAISLIDYRYAPSEAILVHREIKELLAQPEQAEQEPVAWLGRRYGNLLYEDHGYSIPLYKAPPKQPASTAEAVMPNGVRVSNVYDAYEEGRKSVMVKQEPDSYTANVAAKKLFRVLGWTNKGEEK